MDSRRIPAWATTRKASYDKQFYLSVLAVIRNEGPYLAEWIEYHLIVGVEHFWVVDNNSTDSPLEVLGRYIALGLVDFSANPGYSQQVNSYNFLRDRVARLSFWIAPIDIDEFLVPGQGHSVREILSGLEGAAGIFVSAVTYGTNSKRRREDGLVIERFRNHTEWDSPLSRGGKEIATSHMIVKFRVHNHHYWRGIVVSPTGRRFLGNRFRHPPEFKLLWINHYRTKSLEEYVQKVERGSSYWYYSPQTIRQQIKQIPAELAPYRDTVTNDKTVDWAIPIVKRNLAARGIRSGSLQ
jgi:hypothetical protein